MKTLPQRPDLSHLKKQAKELLRDFRSAAPDALARLRQYLPAAHAKADAEIAGMALQLRDAQSCIAREYGFATWTDLKTYVESHPSRLLEGAALALQWLVWVYGRGHQEAKPALAARALREHPQLPGDSPFLACTVGNVARVRQRLAQDPSWVNARDSVSGMTPLMMATYSGLVRLPEFAPGIRECARALIDAGAALDATWSDAGSPNDPLSVLYGAAGRNGDAPLTKMLLDAGADPNDNESLYHAVERSAECVALLLAAGARVSGCNALYRALDFDRIEVLRLLLANGGDANERSGHLGSPLGHAILHRRDVAHVRALLDAGADPRARYHGGHTLYRFASVTGLHAVAELLAQAGGAEALSAHDRFVAACACADADEARRLQREHGDLPLGLSPEHLQVLPHLVAEGCVDGPRLMVELGWPVATPGGALRSGALNHAVFRGDAAMAAFLLDHGAHWSERHRYNDNVFGTLSFASINEPVPGGDWLACAQALIAHGAPLPEPHYEFSDEVTEYFESLRAS